MSYVVLFKIFFYDAFTARQLERLKARLGTGDLYVIADETKGPIGPVDHDRVIRVTERDMLDRGLAASDPQYSLFWYNTDYSLYPLFEMCPEYDYYVAFEHDACINAELDGLVGAIAAEKIDLAAKRLEQPISEWFWTPTCEGIYERETIWHSLNPIAFFSRRAVRLLYDRRLDMSRRLRDGEITQWPFSEAFIGTELVLAGQSVRNLSDFGDTSHIDWWPPFHESELPELARYSFVHPVLEGRRFVESLLRFQDRSAIFNPDSMLAQKLRRLPPQEYVETLFPNLSGRKEKT